MPEILAETRDRNNFIRAIGYLEKVIAANDTDERAWSLLGLLQMETGDLKGANFSYSKALKNAADDPAVLVMTASFFTGTLQFKKASFTLELLRKTDPENENLLVELARYHQARGQYDHSVEPLQELFLRAPEDYDFTLACTLHHLGERAESRAVVAGAFEREVSRADSVARGWYHFLEGDVEKAVSVTTLGMAEYAESSDFRNLAIYYLAQGRYEEARGLLQVFMRLVTQPLDVVFFIKDLESYADRFPRTEARDFTLELAVKLRDMLDPLEEQAGTPDDVAP
ncbi:MAG: tetratricopeptide repeat protein [Planctomycetota bacterium]|nr:tetratricopeptide repeat protein [Planctomycetota bacterium]